MVILKDTQTDPLTDELLHADFLEISMDKEITVEIPIHMSGESEQAKSGEGVVDQLLDFVVVECLPGIIPRELIIDTSGLVIGQVLHVSDLEVPEGVKVFRDPQIPVASMSSTQARMEALEALEAPEEEAEEVDEDAEEVEGEGAEAEEGSEEDKG
jgi:large subunit ribosomal protein L25